MMDPQVAMEKLGAFDTADELAEFLLTEECRGVRGSGQRCPVATWMSRETGIDVMVASCSWSPNYRMLAEAATHGQVTFSMNRPVVSEFICAFDAGRYPELIGDLDAPHW